MVLPRAWRPLPGFEHGVALAVPHVTRIAALPRSDIAGPHCFAEPSFYAFSTVGKLAGAHAGAGSATTRRSGKSRRVLVVGATDVPTGLRHCCQIDAVRRGLNPARSRVSALECGSSRHDFKGLY